LGKFWVALGKRKIIKKFELASLKTLTNSKRLFRKLYQNFCSDALVHVTGSFQDKFLVSGRCMKAGRSLVKRVTGRIFKISK
jgi:hypothetical protein